MRASRRVGGGMAPGARRGRPDSLQHRFMEDRARGGLGKLRVHGALRRALVHLCAPFARHQGSQREALDDSGVHRRSHGWGTALEWSAPWRIQGGTRDPSGRQRRHLHGRPSQAPENPSAGPRATGSGGHRHPLAEGREGGEGGALLWMALPIIAAGCNTKGAYSPAGPGLGVGS